MLWKTSTKKHGTFLQRNERKLRCLHGTLQKNLLCETLKQIDVACFYDEMKENQEAGKGHARGVCFRESRRRYKNRLCLHGTSSLLQKVAPPKMEQLVYGVGNASPASCISFCCFFSWITVRQAAAPEQETKSCKQMPQLCVHIKTPRSVQSTWLQCGGVNSALQTDVQQRQSEGFRGDDCPAALGERARNKCPADLCALVNFRCLIRKLQNTY